MTELETLTALLTKHGKDAVAESFRVFIHQGPGLGKENYQNNMKEFYRDSREVQKQLAFARLAWKFAFTPWAEFEPEKLAKAMTDYAIFAIEEKGVLKLSGNEAHNFRAAAGNCLYQSIGSTTRYKG